MNATTAAQGTFVHLSDKRKRPVFDYVHCAVCIEIPFPLKVFSLLCSQLFLISVLQQSGLQIQPYSKVPWPHLKESVLMTETDD